LTRPANGRLSWPYVGGTGWGLSRVCRRWSLGPGGGRGPEERVGVLRMWPRYPREPSREGSVRSPAREGKPGPPRDRLLGGESSGAPRVGREGRPVELRDPVLGVPQVDLL